jgi:beta-glucosidase
MRLNTALALLAFAQALPPVAWSAMPSPAAAPVVLAQDTKGTPDERAAQLVRQMTYVEKVSMLAADTDQFSTKPIERLGIPSFRMADGPTGVRNGPNGLTQGCAFPCGSALAATWNPDLATAYGKAIGLEARARGVQFQLGPGVNICRVPVNGRNFEYFGEDPFLAAVITAHWTKACSDQGVVPTVKHFAANNQEQERDYVNAIIDERVLHEIYLPAFKKAVKEGGTVAIMCSYNRLNGHYASNSNWLQNEVLRGMWRFKGLVMSDWGASHSPDDILRGLDLEMPTGENLNKSRLEQAIAVGQMKESELRAAVDVSVQRLLRTAAAVGWLDAAWKRRDESLPLDSADSHATALAVAREAMVLLKNADNFLPLDRAKVRKIILLGPNATRVANGAPAPAGGGVEGRRALRGGSSAPNVGGGGSSAVTPFASHDDEGDYYASIKKLAGDKISVTYLPTTASQLAGDAGLAKQVSEADAVVVVVGFNRGSETESFDRAFDLPAEHVALIRAASKANPHTLVITNGGAGVGIAPWQENAAAIIHAYYLGQGGGIAIAEALFGDLNPSGKLCSTFDAKWEENPAFPYYPSTNHNGIPAEPYAEGLFYGYRGYDKAGKSPLYPFGFGLSYTTFDLSNFKLERSGADVTVSFNLNNTGTRAGAQVVQLYVGEMGCPQPRPLRELKGFAKITLQPGESVHKQVILHQDAFAYWSPDKKDWTVDPGKSFTIEAAFSERDIKAKAKIGL